MKVVAKNTTPVTVENAALLEKEGEQEQAAAMYEKLLQKEPADQAILSRLMIISRRLKAYKKELGYINQAIKIYEQRYDRLKSKDVKVVALSKKLNRLLGHTDQRGKNLLDIPEVIKLKKRKAVVMKKMKA